MGINSQQLGYRLIYTERAFGLDWITTNYSIGSVDAVDAPGFEQATSTADVLPQDHLDIIGVGPDTFDEMEFYAAIIGYMAYIDRRTVIPVRRKPFSPVRDFFPPQPWNSGPVTRWLTP